MAMDSSSKWAPWSIPVILAVDYMGDFVQRKAGFEFTAL